MVGTGVPASFVRSIDRRVGPMAEMAETAATRTWSATRRIILCSISSLIALFIAIRVATARARTGVAQTEMTPWFRCQSVPLFGGWTRTGPGSSWPIFATIRRCLLAEEEREVGETPVSQRLRTRYRS
ncbi:hypothetical protein GBAR_LOCUS24739 [Geodia barretti]|uniref:Uncharacterized protein n=1 Tax=Geodia barretti TaxID=519541 RepID=A0AA35XAU3_GEOBA|nr:hypothetical protein GBAR_LOCUS24739 [Geodia barretti]